MNRVGRAGPICRRAFARPYKLMVIGNYSFWIAQAGISKGSKTDAVADVVTRGLSRQRAATCPRLPAPKVREGLTLNPDAGPAQTGKRPEFVRR
jgi:hypothetical protein